MSKKRKPTDDESVAECAADLQAYWLSRAEAESWSRVHAQILRSTVSQLRAVGLSHSQIAVRLRLPKTTVTRTIARDGLGGRSPMSSPDWGQPERDRFDDTWIKAGNHAVASPDGQYRHGLISEAQREALNEQSRMSRETIPAQLHELVNHHPGHTADELAGHMAVARLAGTPASFASHAAAAQVAIDGRGRYWPTLTVGELQPGDRVPRHAGAFDATEGGEWVTIERLDRDGDGTVQEVHFTLSDGLTSSWPAPNLHDRHPVDRRKETPHA